MLVLITDNGGSPVTAVVALGIAFYTVGAHTAGRRSVEGLAGGHRTNETRPSGRAWIGRTPRAVATTQSPPARAPVKRRSGPRTSATRCYVGCPSGQRKLRARRHGTRASAVRRMVARGRRGSAHPRDTARNGRRPDRRHSRAEQPAHDRVVALDQLTPPPSPSRVAVSVEPTMSVNRTVPSKGRAPPPRHARTARSARSLG